ncbi:MAG TPA: ABATE domain-containing protein [Candidatus Acidoferrum sp.]|nr:ABATE domain-containing protein [Candidatus Acidoferrum sp.]
MKRAANRSDWKDGFLFLGNELVLDFLNTRPIQDRKPMELLPGLGAVLRWFQAADLLDSEQVARLERQWEGTTEAQKTTEVMKDLRERWREEILAWEGGRAIRSQTLDELNRVMAMHPMLTRLTKSRTAYSTKLWFEVREPADLLAPLAHSAATLFATGDRKRVRKCANCVLHFHDTSKKGTRRWCSMQLCGNRFKVAAYAARQQKDR